MHKCNKSDKNMKKEATQLILSMEQKLKEKHSKELNSLLDTNNQQVADNTNKAGTDKEEEEEEQEDVKEGEIQQTEQVHTEEKPSTNAVPCCSCYASSSSCLFVQ